MNSRNRAHRSSRLPWVAAAIGLAAACGKASAGPTAFPLAFGRDWWLPENFSEHGKSIDTIFLAIFWITSVIFVACQVVLVYFLVKYRARKDRKKGIFSHGNTKLEMWWTLIPSVILIALALWTKGVWDNYRYNPAVNDPNLVRVLVIGQQFKWNVIYPGPDGELGRYLLYPKTTDLKWPALPEGKSFEFPAVPGPAFLPEDQARGILNSYIETVNPLGKDYDDPRGKDDDYQDALARAVEVPKGRPVEINLGSRDVIHDFYLPNFRVKLDAVPGMRGKLYLTATKSAREMQGAPKVYTLDELQAFIHNREVVAVVNEKSKGAEHVVKKRPRPVDFWRYASKDGDTLLRDGSPVTEADLPKLREAGVTEITAFAPFYWDLVCEELCGQGHYTMQGKFIVLEPDELKKEPYTKFFKQPKNVAADDKGIN